MIDGAPAVLQQLYELEQLAAAPLVEAVRVRLVCECYTAYRWLPSTLSELKQRMQEQGVELKFSAAPEFGAGVEQEFRTWGKAVELAKVKLD